MCNSVFLIQCVSRLTLYSCCVSLSDTRMVAHVRYKQAKSLMKQSKYEMALILAKRLQRSYEMHGSAEEGTGDLQQVYAMLVDIYVALNQPHKLKRLLTNGDLFKSAVADPQAQSVLCEAWGRIHATAQDWHEGYGSFVTAFKYHVDLGNRVKAARCFELSSVMHILSLPIPSSTLEHAQRSEAKGTANPWLLREARTYYTDPLLSIHRTLVRTATTSNAKEFFKALDVIRQREHQEKLLASLLKPLITHFRRMALCRKLQVYRTIRLSSLTSWLHIDTTAV